MKKMILLLIATMFMSACVSPTATNTPTASPQGQFAFTPVPTGTETPVPPTAVALPNLETQCIPISSAPADLKMGGTALFLDGPMIVSLGEKALRIPSGPADPSVSPHNRFLAYHEGADLLVATSNGTVIRRVKSNIAISLVGGNWISDNYIRHFSRISWNPLRLQPHVINVQTGESLDLRMDFPNMDEEGGWMVENAALYYLGDKTTDVIYDPLLSRAVYPKKGSFISLYDVLENREQAVIRVEKASDPIWSPDGQYFTFKVYDQRTPTEIYIISRDGDRFMPLTHLSQRYPHISFGAYSWSPDSQKIAFWARKTDKYGEYEGLFIFDFASRRIVDACIEGIGSWGSITGAGLINIGAGPSPLDKYFVLGGRLVWSPDSSKIIIAQFDEENQQVVDLLVDLERNIAYPIATGLEPMGWLAGEP